MKIELLKQRFMHLGLLTCLVVGGAMTTMSHANIDNTINFVTTSLRNNGDDVSKNFANMLDNSKRELFELFKQVKQSIDQNNYSANVDRIRAEFDKLKHTILIPMAGVPNCAQAHAELNRVFSEFEELVKVLNGLRACNPNMRKVAAFARLKRFNHLMPAELSAA